MSFRLLLLAVLVASLARLDLSSAECGGDSTACGAPPTNSDVDYLPKYTCYGNTDTVTYSCSGSSTGPSENVCNSGSWGNPSPTCDVFTCARPSVENDVMLTPNKTTYGAREIVAYSCSAGDTLTGSSSATCNGQDEWNPSAAPLCRASCSMPTINNGAVSPTEVTFYEGDTATVTCDSGYSLEAGSSATVTCGNDGDWEDLPTCLETCSMPSIPNTNYASGGTLDHGQTVYISCDEGTSYQQETVFEVTCFYDGLRYKTVTPTQCYSDCPAWSSPDNGAVVSTNYHESTATFSCNRGYHIENPDDTTTICENGSWDRTDPNPPNCTALEGTDRVTLVCNSNGFRVLIPLDLMTDQTGGGVHLQDSTCVGKANNGYAVINSDYSDCGTTVQVNNYTKEISYINRVQAEKSTSGITTEVFFDLSIQCIFDQENLVSTNVVIANNITSALGFRGGPVFSLQFYRDDLFDEERAPPFNLYGYDLAYVKIELQTDPGSSIFGTHCHASPASDALDNVYQDLLIDGCAVDTGVTILDTSEEIFPKRATAFSMSKIQFKGDGNSIYIHCYAKICGEGEDCSNSCPHRRKRRNSDGSWYQRVSNGPITWNPETTADRRLDETVVTYLLFGCGVVSTISLILVLYVAYRYFSRKAPPKGESENSE